MMDKKELKITSFEDLKKYSQGDVVELPAFGENQPFVARLRRPSLLDLMRSGTIPNELLNSATKLFDSGVAAMVSPDIVNIEELGKLLDVVCEASFLEPTYKEIRDAGVRLSDDQLLFVFSYSQLGVKQLKSFRGE